MIDFDDYFRKKILVIFKNIAGGGETLCKIEMTRVRGV